MAERRSYVVGLHQGQVEIRGQNGVRINAPVIFLFR